MDAILCDEILQEILKRLPESSRPAASLVSKRWMSLLRSAIPTLSLSLPSATSALIYGILSQYSSISTLSLFFQEVSSPGNANSVLLALSDCAAYHLPNLRHLRFLSGPISTSILADLPSYSPLLKLQSFHISSLSHVSFKWLLKFPFLRDLAIHDCSGEAAEYSYEGEDDIEGGEICLDFISFGGIQSGDVGFGWLWRRCPKLQRLQLRGCEGTGDGPSSRFFAHCLPNLREIELRKCRAIADIVLLLVANHCTRLMTLLLYDGGSRDGLHQFIRKCGPSLRILDLRLPLDLDNGHLLAFGENFRLLSCLRLQSCCLVTGDGLRSLAGGDIEELVLVNCDVVEREPGLLTFLGQSLKKLKKLDLSHNEFLRDKELRSMLASCGNLIEIKLRGCKGLSDAVMVSLSRFCGVLEAVDISRCEGISEKGVEFLILGSPRLRQIHVEEIKVSETAYLWASRRMIQVF